MDEEKSPMRNIPSKLAVRVPKGWNVKYFIKILDIEKRSTPPIPLPIKTKRYNFISIKILFAIFPVPGNQKILPIHQNFGHAYVFRNDFCGDDHGHPGGGDS